MEVGAQHDMTATWACPELHERWAGVLLRGFSLLGRFRLAAAFAGAADNTEQKPRTEVTNAIPLRRNLPIRCPRAVINMPCCA
ncbi:hypothetical protein NL676_015518 [Syzygium grande]|nr:hypothetical protein NL676_015518 [Syzygium grande]